MRAQLARIKQAERNDPHAQRHLPGLGVETPYDIDHETACLARNRNALRYANKRLKDSPGRTQGFTQFQPATSPLRPYLWRAMRTANSWLVRNVCCRDRIKAVAPVPDFAGPHRRQIAYSRPGSLETDIPSAHFALIFLNFHGAFNTIYVSAHVTIEIGLATEGKMPG
jgi:hypothetical protein